MVEMGLNYEKEFNGIWITRVPGGWIYNILDSKEETSFPVFVSLPLVIPRVLGVDYV